MTDRNEQLEQLDAPLDVDALMKRCLGRIDLVERILDRFETAFVGELEQLAEALQSEDTEKVGSIAHRIKGTSLTVSANELSRHAAELERVASTGEVDRFGSSVEAIKHEWERVRRNLPLTPPKAIE